MKTLMSEAPRPDAPEIWLRGAGQLAHDALDLFFFFLMERITTRILKTIEDKNPYRLLDPERQMSDGVT